MGGRSQTIPSTTTQISQTEIPAFLRPYLENQAQVGQTALTGLQSAVSNGLPDQQVAGFTPQQLQAHQMLQSQIAGPESQSIQTLRGALTNPNGIHQNSLNGLRAIGNGGWINQMTPTLNGGMEQAINGQFIPGSATNTLDSFAQSGYELSGPARSALEQSASGANLYGTPAFDQAVQASIRAAQPAIASTFSNAGSGGLKSGLAQTAMQQAASDSFARLYSDERNRQLSSAQQLGSFGLAGRDQQIGAASQRGNLALGEQGLRTQATLGLGGLMSQERQRQLQALQTAPGVGLMGIESLNGMENQQQAQRMQQILALNGMGDQHQDQNQAVLDAMRSNQMNPILAQQLMLAAAQGLPIESLMGQNSSANSMNTMYRNRGAGALGGAASGAALGGALGGAAKGSALGPYGALIGAIGGGLLGAFG